MTTGTFIISLDCEGKWGIADSLKPYHHELITNLKIAETYRRLTRLFGEYEIPATFAFVMAFTLTEAERREFADLLAGPGDPWLAHYHRAKAQGLGDGWFQPAALDIVRSDPRHEIACHGFCHRPLGEGDISEEGAIAELQAAAAVAGRKGLALETLVFPRNHVGHVKALRPLGYIGYRRSRPPSRIFPQMMAMASELNVWTAPEPYGVPSGRAPVGIPAGRFFNWRFGMRKLVPAPATVLRWKKLLNRAADTGQVAHLWLHPHNLITGPGTARPLEEVLAYAASLRDRGRLEVMTQRDYCRSLFAADPAVSPASPMWEAAGPVPFPQPTH